MTTYLRNTVGGGGGLTTEMAAADVTGKIQ
jgi:hypothetical protein